MQGAMSIIAQLHMFKLFKNPLYM